MRQELNPGLRDTTARTATLRRPDSRFTASVLELVNLGYADYNALQMSVHKRFSKQLPVPRVVHLLESRRHRRRGRRDRHDQYADDRSGHQSGVVEPGSSSSSCRIRIVHTSCRSADRVEVPHTKGLIVSGAYQYQSGTPFTITDSTLDPNRNGNFEEPLPAGTYSGDPARADAITVENNGGLSGARGPDFQIVNLRAGYRFKLPGNRSLQAHVDIFNVTNRANFNSPTRRPARRGDLPHPASPFAGGGPTRTAQFNLRYSF